VAGQKQAIVCRWTLEGSTLILQAVSDAAVWSLDVAQSTLTLGGFNEDQIVLKQDELVFYAVRAELEGPLRGLGLERIHRALGQEKARVRQAVRMSYVGLAALIALVLTAGWWVWWVTDRAVDSATAMTPVSWDVELGKAVSFGSMGSEVTDPKVLEPVRQMVAELSRSYQEKGFVFEVHVLDQDELNAFALPGGQIAVFTGLLKAAEGPDEVAGVLAHEIQHVVRRHSVRKIYGQLRWQLALSILVGDSRSLYSQLMSSGALLAGLSYDRDMESEADREGVLLLKQVGYPQTGMIKFFKKLQQLQGTTEKQLKYLSTHPPSEDRIAALNKMLEGRTQGGLKVDWEGLQRALKKRGKGSNR